MDCDTHAGDTAYNGLFKVQAGQHWALSHMPLRGEVLEVIAPLRRKIKSAKGQAALQAALEKLEEKGRERYVVPTALTAVSRHLQVRA